MSVQVGATAQASGITANDFTNPVRTWSRPRIASTQTYTVTVTIAPNPAKDMTAFAFLARRTPR